MVASDGASGATSQGGAILGWRSKKQAKAVIDKDMYSNLWLFYLYYLSTCTSRAHAQRTKMTSFKLKRIKLEV